MGRLRQRHEHRHLIQTNLLSLSNSKHSIWLQINHSTNTVLHKIIKQHHFNKLQPQQSCRTYTLAVALDIRKAFDTVNMHSHINYTRQTSHTPFCSNLLQTTSKDVKPSLDSETKHIHTTLIQTGVPQYGVLMPTLLYIRVSHDYTCQQHKHQ